MRTTEEIKSIIGSIIEEKGLFLVDLSVSKDNVIEIFIDSPTGVDVGTCIITSKELEQHFNRDEEDFELTVSSAGIGYPFKVPGQYLKNIGKQVEVRLADGSKLAAKLTSFNGTAIGIEYEEKVSIEGKKKKETIKKEQTIVLSDIKQIKDIVVF